MADAVDMKISQLDAAVSVADADIFPETSGAVSKKVPASVLKNYMIGTGDISALGDGSVTGAILNVKSASETADSNIAETMAHNGAHQFLYNRIKSSVIVGGLTITPHDDGSFTVGAGTATSDDTIMVSGTGTSSWSQAEQKLPIGNYYASCEGAVEGVYLRLNVEENNQQKIVRGTDVSIAVSSAPSNTLAFIQVLNGTVIPAGGITIKPLIRLQSDTVKTIAPYAMTNGELTDECKNLSNKMPEIVNKTNGLTPNADYNFTLENDSIYLLITGKALNTDIGSSLFIVVASSYGSTLTQIYKGSNIAAAVNNLTLTVNTDTQYVSVRLIKIG